MRVLNCLISVLNGILKFENFNNLKRILFILEVTVNFDLFKCSQIFYPGFELGFSLVPSYKHLGFFSFQSHFEKELNKIKLQSKPTNVPGPGHPG